MKNIVFAAAALFAVSAIANEALMELDLDQDGAISMEEAANVEGMTADTWAILDSNADGKLDKAEFAMFEELQAAPADTATDAAVEATTDATETAVEIADDAVEATTDAAATAVEGAVEAVEAVKE